MAVLCKAFRYLAGAHYGVAVAALTGTVVILLSFEGVAPDAAVSDRVINTALGCGVALLAYVAWPTWERSRARDALAGMLAAYADYLDHLARCGGAVRGEIRSAARTARINAQASIERMRSEPATPPALLALARQLLANGNRLARTAMTLEAMLGDLARLPPQTGLAAFIEEATRALRAISDALRRQAPPPDLPDLRAAQRALVSRAAGADAALVEVLGRISDRLVDNIDTLAHVVARSQPHGGHDTRPQPSPA
jgi:uncharacterized membrane protein YccC